MLSVGHRIPSPDKGALISSGTSKSKVELLEASRMLKEKGYKLYATSGTAAFMADNGIEAEVVHWPDSEKKPNVLDCIAAQKIDLVINIPKNHTQRELENGHKIRRAAVDHNIPLITNARLASAYIWSVCKIGIEGLGIRHWGEY